MANNPYAEINDDEGAPLTPVVAPEPIHLDRGEPTTKAPKKRKSGVIFAVIGVLLGTLIGLGMFGYFFYNAVIKKDKVSIVVPTDPALTPKESDGPDLNQYKAKVKKDNAVAAQRERDEQADASKSATANNGAATDGNTAANGQGGAPDRGRYAGQPQNASGSNGQGSGKKELTPQEIAEQRRFKGDVVSDESTASGDSEFSGDRTGNSTGSRQTNSRSMTAEERLRQNPFYSQAMAQGAGGGASESEGSNGSSESIGDMLKTEKMANGTVIARPDLKFLLINGTSIPCTLIPRVVTDYPATVRCMVNRDVYSADASVLLIAKGSVARGERKVSLKSGQTMVYVAWGTIDTTDGLKINTDSMAADNLGAAGIKAVIDNHYGQRFGGAILLSFLDDVLKAAAKNNSTTNGVNFDGSTQNAQDMASIALQQSINMPPTGYVQHATELNIIVARDIDFRNIYGVN